MTETTRSLFARRLRQYRKYLGYSQREMASKLGIAKSTLLGWEKIDGHGQPTWEQLHQLCSWTGIEPIYFFISEDFATDFLDVGEQLKALPHDLRDSIITLVSHLARTNIKQNSITI